MNKYMYTYKYTHTYTYIHTHKYIFTVSAALPPPLHKRACVALPRA